MYGGGGQRIDVDGQRLPIASMLRRGTAVSVDLCLAVALGSLGFYVISTFTPLDGDSANTPVLLVMGVVIAYVAWGRNRFRSPGRSMFRLRLARLPGPGPGLLGRSVTVHTDPEPVQDSSQLYAAIIAIILCTLSASLLLGIALANTTVYQSVKGYTIGRQPLARERGGSVTLGGLPRAVLIGRQRAYVQATAEWPDSTGVLEFFLARRPNGWVVTQARVAEEPMFAHFALSIADEDIPAP